MTIFKGNVLFMHDLQPNHIMQRFNSFIHNPRILFSIPETDRLNKLEHL